MAAFLDCGQNVNEKSLNIDLLQKPQTSKLWTHVNFAYILMYVELKICYNTWIFLLPNNIHMIEVQVFFCKYVLRLTLFSFLLCPSTFFTMWEIHKLERVINYWIWDCTSLSKFLIAALYSLWTMANSGIDILNKIQLQRNANNNHRHQNHNLCGLTHHHIFHHQPKADALDNNLKMH